MEASVDDLMKLVGCVDHGSAAPGEVIVVYTGLWKNKPLPSLSKAEKALLIAAYQVCWALANLLTILELGKRLDPYLIRTGLPLFGLGESPEPDCFLFQWQPKLRLCAKLTWP
jgi:hypothetical protein